LGLLTVGLGDVCGCTTTTLEGVGLEGGLTVLRDGVTLGEFSCRAVLLPVFPLAWPAG
jgi:hypothetical protein